MSRAPRAIFIIALVLVFAVPVSAQQGQPTHNAAAADMETPAQTAVIPGPTLASAAFTVPAPRIASSALSAPFAPSSRNTALMIVGGAGLLVGAVIGGDEGTIIMIAGGGIGLLGLWRHLK